MDITAKRMAGFIYRSRWLGKIMSSPYHAGIHWIRIRFSPQLKAMGKYGSYRFKFRGMDVPIIREVIHEKEYDFLKSQIEHIKEPNILDVGAHIGLFSICMLNIVPSAHILSVEAGPDTFQMLTNNVERAKSEKAATWKAINRAAWSDSSIIKFNDAGMSMSQQVNKDGKIEVSGVSLAELIEMSGADKIDLMKVDIEGAEEEFLCATPEILKNIDRLVIELHNECCDVEKVKDLLDGSYAEVKYLKDRNSNRPVLYCYR
jgi:FkbM family methyltransferase